MFATRHILTAVLLGTGLSAAASAAEYTAVDAAASRLTFQYAQMGVGMDGKFERFGASIRFDPARLGDARATLDIQVGSIDTGSADGNSEVKAKTWFDTANHPVAHFESASFKALGGERYEVAGKLTIKGRTRDVAAPFTFKPDGKAATVQGRFAIQRSDFAIGEGEWADTSIVGNDIQIHFQLRALQGTK